MFPFPGDSRTPSQVKADYFAIVGEFTSGKLKTEEDVWDAIGRLEHRVPWTTEEIRGYDPNEIGCKVWGHACPVFFVQSGTTETKDARSESRMVPRDIMLKVVRRDNHICQICRTNVLDNQVEFDHIIPFSRGGPTTVENIRLLCASCNRKKSNSLAEILE
jgi:hypothetical protein